MYATSAHNQITGVIMITIMDAAARVRARAICLLGCRGVVAVILSSTFESKQPGVGTNK